MKTTIFLARHGETAWNKERRIQGNVDIPLSKEGLRQAQLLAKRLQPEPISVIYASALERAIKTAEPLAQQLGLPIIQRAGFNERNYGEYEGKKVDDLLSEFEGDFLKLVLATPPQGESIPVLRKRAVKTFDEVRTKHQGETILIVSHGGVLQQLVRHLRNIPEEEITNYSFPNTSVSIFHFEEETIVEQLVGDASHLSE